MKRISQNKFASSLFSCLGVAACVAFSSCGKKDNDKFESADEFEKFLQDKAQKEQVTFESDDLTKFANNNYKTASKKTFQFTEEIKKQIAGEDPDNEDDELSDQEQPDQSKPEQPNPDTEQTTPVQPSPDQSKPNTEQSEPTTADSSGTTTISDKSKLSELISKTESGKHVGVKIDGKCFDLNVFSDLYYWIYSHADNTGGLVEPAKLTFEHVKKIIINSGSLKKRNIDSDDERFGISSEVSSSWKEEDRTYLYTFTASKDTNGAKSLECLLYNGLLKFWAQANDLGFSENSFQNGELSRSCSNCGGNNEGQYKQKINSVVTKLAEYLKE